MNTTVENKSILSPVLDMWETDEQYRIVAEMPGVSASDLTLEMEGETLTLRGEARSSLPNDPGYREFGFGTYFARVHVGPMVDRDAISANMKNGTLEVRLPKQESAVPRQIEVNAA